MYNNSNRRDYYKKDNHLENVLKELNDTLEQIPSTTPEDFKPPIILVMGVARSGSTLLMQLLAESGLFSFPSNLIARFYKNPYLGIQIQQSLIDFDPLNQMDFNLSKSRFNSKLGKTMGALSPSEYWYFWREYFKFGELQQINERELVKVDGSSFVKKLLAFQYLTGKPLALKGMIMNWHIPYLNSIYPNFIFVNIKRDRFFNAQSILHARREFFGSIDKWYSFKPKEYELLKERTPIEQVAGQVVYTQQAIKKGLSEIELKNKLEVTYEEVCNAPKRVVQMLLDKIKDFDNNVNKPLEYINPKFEVNQKVSLSEEEECDLNRALKEYSL